MGFLNNLFLKLIGMKTLDPYMDLILKADENDLIADELFRLSLAYKEGRLGLKHDDKKAMTYCQKAAERGHVVAQLFMTMWLMNYPDDASPDVLKWLELAALQGEKQACYNYGISIHRGDIPNKDKVIDSIRYIRKSAEFGYIPACARMSVIYASGDEVEQNFAIAKYWAMLEYTQERDPQQKSRLIFLKLVEEKDILTDETGSQIINIAKIIEDAANAGERDAMVRGAINAIADNREEGGFKLLREAISKGHPTAPMTLAVHLLKGEKPDYKECLNLLEISAKEGCEESQYNLAVLYSKNEYGELDIEKCWYWLEKALNYGNKYAQGYFSQLCQQNKFEAILRDPVMRGPAYAELAAMNQSM